MFKSILNFSSKESADSIFLLAYIAEIKEWDNRAHLKRIRGYTYTISTAMGIPKSDAEAISAACQLHDIGKSTTPDELLLRTGEYTPEEWRLMEKHTYEGEEILRQSSSPLLQMAAKIANSHHERFDGSGYPNKLSGEDIPLSGRICAVADVFDALTTKRLYKKMMPDEEALDLIQRASGTLFDPRAVQAFSDRFKEILEIKKNSAE